MDVSVVVAPGHVCCLLSGVSRLTEACDKLFFAGLSATSTTTPSSDYERVSERCQLIIRGAMQAVAPRLEAAVSLPDGARIGWFNPLVEIASMRHARANERLFIS